ncbi:MAG: AAA family ATPase [Candidatus Pacebacteria bacterium CG10_big_fil_rev_8_21_14_0_10_44_11]|nr:MAG: AAA family ATPase [Candidatus Pacebacteria bacterium CG10_big_fil_rev_8_21_14_0_10_44_11]
MSLALILRPQSLAEFIGQKHLVGEDKPLRIAIEKGHVFSMIFWGPPGVGKTTLARMIAHSQGREFVEFSAVSAGKKDIQQLMQRIDTMQQLKPQLAPILFLDEIHRFNKAQQDYLLPFVEEGRIVLIGATTENPSFEIISALLSRSKVFTLQPLSSDELKILVKRAIKELIKQTGKKIKVDAEAEAWLINFSAGDARKLLNLVENTFELYSNLSLDSLKSTLQTSAIKYDKDGEEHYDTISAFIKSMRASNVDAALYYLARMVHAGEDPKFIARRMVIFASEDIGLAAPTALVVANAVFDAVTKIGYPEAQINLAHGVAYLANCKKNRSAYDAYFSVLRDVEQTGNLPIPLELRNAPTKLMKELGYGKGYQMYPDQSKSLLPAKLKNKKYFSKST